MEKGVWFPSSLLLFLLVSGSVIFPVAESQQCPSALFENSKVRYIILLYRLEGNPTKFDWSVEQGGTTRTVSSCDLSKDVCTNDEISFVASMDNRYVMYFTITGEYRSVTRVTCHDGNRTYLSCPVNIREEVSSQLMYPANGTAFTAPLYGKPSVVFSIAGPPALLRLYYKDSGQYVKVENEEFVQSPAFIGKAMYRLYNMTLTFPIKIYDEAFFRLDIPTLSEILQVFFSVVGRPRTVPFQLVSPPNNTVLPVPLHNKKYAAFVIGGYSFRSSVKLYRQDNGTNVCIPINRSSYEVTVLNDYGDPSKQQSEVVVTINDSPNVTLRYCVDIQVNQEQMRIHFTHAPTPARLISPANNSELTASAEDSSVYIFTVAGFIFPYLNFLSSQLYWRNGDGVYSVVRTTDYQLYTTQRHPDVKDRVNVSLRFNEEISGDNMYRLDLGNRLQSIRIYFSIGGDERTDTGMVVGIAVGIGVPIIVIIVIFVLMIRARRTRRTNRAKLRERRNLNNASHLPSSQGGVTSSEDSYRKKLTDSTGEAGSPGLSDPAPPYPGK